MRNCALGLSTARGRWPRAVLKTSNTVSPNTDRPRPVNNIITLYGIAFVALREALWYSVSTSTCIQHVTQVHFRDRRGRASLRPARKPRRHNRFFCVCEQKPNPIWFSWRRKSYPVYCEHSLNLYPVP